VTGTECPSGHTVPYGVYNGGWGGGGTTGACPNHNPPPLPGPGTVSCQGTVAVTLTWVPQGSNDPVPTLVVLRKESTANWGGGDSGSCANGLGHAPVGGAGGEVSTGVKYEVLQSPASPIQLTITPSASVTASSASDVGTASVVVKVSAVVPSLAFAGTKESEPPMAPKQDNILVGQRLTSTVQLGGLPQGTQDTFTWTVPDGSPFNAYTTTDTLGEYFGFSPPNTATAGWHFAKGVFGDPEAGGGTPCEVSCNVVLREPEPDISLTVSRIVHIFKPNVVLGLDLTIGTVQLFPDAANPTHLILIGLPWTGGKEAGAIWEAKLVRVPFFDQPGQPYERGKWGVFQLATGKLEWQRTGDPLRKNENYGLWGLDLGVPYNYAAGEHELDNQPHRGSDTPGIGVLGIAGTEWASIDFAFFTELMYRPPGSGSVWVPLKAPKAWFAKGKATKVPPWTLTDNAQGLSPGHIPAEVFFNWVRGLTPPIYWIPSWP